MTSPSFAVIPVLVGPLQVLLTLLPALLVSLGGLFLALFKPSTFKQSLRLLWRLKFPLLILVGMFYGAVWLVRAAWPKPKVSQAEAVAIDWPLYRGQAARAGAVPGAPPPTSGGVNWAFRNEDKTFYASPAVVGNRIYITSADKGVFTDRGAIYCLDADTGAVVWKSAPDGFRATFSSPSVSGKYLVVGEGLHYTYNARIVCLDITQQGKMLWQFRTTNHVESTACIYNKRAYIGAGDDGYYCLELEPGPNGQPRMVWHVTRDQCPDAETAPVAADGKIYAGLGMDGHALVCLDANNGRELWRLPTPYPVFTPPTIVAGKIIIGMGNGNFVETADEVMAKELKKLEQHGASPQALEEARQHLRAAGEVWAVDTKTHQMVWRFKTSDTVLGAIAGSEDGRLYFGSRDGWLYCLSMTGQELGRWNAHSAIMTSPALAGNCVYFVTANGKLFALDRLTLKPLWETLLGTQGLFVSSPVVARGHVYAGTQGEGLLCVGKAGGALDETMWAGPQGGPGRPGHLDNSPLPDRGALVWRWPPGSEGSGDSAPAPRITAPAAIFNDLIAIPIATGARRGLLALTNSPNTRAIPAERWFYPVSNGVWLSPALVEANIITRRFRYLPRLVFLVDGKTGDPDRHLHCLDAWNGAIHWRVPVSADASGEFVVLDRSVLIQSGDQEVACLSFSARPRWRKPLGALRGIAAGGKDLAVMALASAPGLLVLDLPTGQELWRVELNALTGPVVDGGTVFVGTDKGVTAYHLTDGRVLWQTASAAPAQPLLLENGILATVTRSNELVLLDAKSGRVQAAVPGARADQSLVLVRDAALFATRDALMRVPFDQPKPQRWMATAWLGELSTPMVMADSAVYFATPARGFIKTGRLK